MKTRGFTLIEVLIVVVIVGILLSVAVPTIFCQVQKSKDTQDLVNVDIAKKMAVARHLDKGSSYKGNSVYYFDAHKSKVLDASDTADISKISEIKVYGISPNEHSSSEKLGAIGIPKNRILEVSIDESANITSICWVDLASAVAKGMAFKSEISVGNNKNNGNGGSGQSNSNGGVDESSNGGGTTSGTSGGTSGGTTGGASGGTTGGASGGTTGGASGGTTGGASGGTSGGASGGTTGGASGGTSGGASGGTSGGASGGTTGGASGGIGLPGSNGNIDDGSEGTAKPDSVGDAANQENKSPFAESWTEPESVNGIETLAKAIISGRSSSVPRDADISFCDKYGIDGYVINTQADKTAAADYAAQKNGSRDAYTKIITQVNISGTNSTNTKLEPGVYKATQYLVSGTQRNKTVTMHVSGVREIYVNVINKNTIRYYSSEADAQSKTNDFWPSSNTNWN